MNSLLVVLLVFLLSLLGDVLSWKRLGRDGSSNPNGRRLVLAAVSGLGLAIVCGGLFILAQDAKDVSSSDEARSDATGVTHCILLLDHSPSMDASAGGMEPEVSRLERARVEMRRIAMAAVAQGQGLSFVVVHREARLVILDSSEPEVVGHLLESVPLHYGFGDGRTHLDVGLREVERIAQSWQRGTTVLYVASDGLFERGDQLALPDSIQTAQVLGVGPVSVGAALGEESSGQDASALRALAAELSGGYTDISRVDFPLISSSELEPAGSRDSDRRTYVLAACLVAASCVLLRPLGRERRTA